MTNVFCNLARKKLGRSAGLATLPTGYYGETDTWRFYFEDIMDGYASGLENVDKDTSTCGVRIGARGIAPATLTINNGAFSNLVRTVNISQAFEELDTDANSMGRLTWAFDQTPVAGEFRLKVSANVVFPAQPGLSGGTQDTAVYTLHGVQTAGLSALASPGDIEDALLSLLTEFLGGEHWSGNMYRIYPGGGTEPENTLVYESSGVGSFDIFAAAPLTQAINLLTRSVRVDSFKDNRFEATIDIRPFPVSVYISSGPDIPGTFTQAQNGYINITAMSIEDADTGTPTLLGAAGKSATVDFTDPAFGTLLGSALEKKLWMEVLLDSQTVCDGEILLKKRMA